MNPKLKYFLSSLILVIALLTGAVASIPDNKLHLIFCDVGQGDAILAVKGSAQILIDGGPSNKVLGCLSEHLPFWDRKIELIVLTHPESDHITGLVSVIERYSVDQILANSLVTDTGVFSKFRSGVIEKKIPVYSPKNGDKIKIAGMVLNILYPEEKMGDEIAWKDTGNKGDLGSFGVLGVSAYTGNFNETAIVTELSYGNFNALLTGDIGVEQEIEIESFDFAQDKTIDVLKVAHHGSKYSTSKEFLEKIKPKLAVISVGANNRYGHPTSEVLGRLRDLGVKILRTDTDGEVEVVSDGNHWNIKNQK